MAIWTVNNDGANDVQTTANFLPALVRRGGKIETLCRGTDDDRAQTAIAMAWEENRAKRGHAGEGRWMMVTARTWGRWDAKIQRGWKFFCDEYRSS
jgi:hypothetical protein